ncbi:MAG TPA: hypothetical protein VFH70_11610 [Acidimicrobiales bacterium]|nr:hypothetical protein [Acidimicrobiales bacterium]
MTGASQHAALAWSTMIAEKTAQVTGLQINVYSQTFSPQVGTMVFGTMVPDLPALETAWDKLLVDDGYNDLVEQGLHYFIPGSFDDSLALCIHPAGGPDVSPRDIEYLSVVSSTVNPGHHRQALELGVRIAQRIEKVAAVPAMFVTESTGSFGGVAWLLGLRDAAELERAQMSIYSDEQFLKMLDEECNTAFSVMPEASTQTLLRRLV